VRLSPRLTRPVTDLNVSGQLDWNHRGGLEEIIRREEHDDRPIFLSDGRDSMMAAHRRLALLKHHREDLLHRTMYFDATTLDATKVPRRALILIGRDNPALSSLVGAGELKHTF
jgi:hypothetical protein